MFGIVLISNSFVNGPILKWVLISGKNEVNINNRVPGLQTGYKQKYTNGYFPIPYNIMLYKGFNVSKILFA